MAHDWDPALYGTYADERARPFFDLLARVPATDPSFVVDLGCGTGALTAALARRWPRARVLGVDSSPAMVAAAQPADGVEHEVADLAGWRAPRPVDVLVSNAALQWVPGHRELLAGFLDGLAPGGWLAFQVPGNERHPSHALRQELEADPRFAPYLVDVRGPAAHDPGDYLETLVALGCEVDAWETTYLHVLRGPDPVLTWVSATSAAPALQALPDEPRAAFESELRDALRAAYPTGPHGTVLPFRRVFVVARRPGGVPIS